jgi:actin-related protein
LYTVGCTTGLVIDIGHGVTAITPIVQGYPITLAIKRYNFAGQDVTSYLTTLLTLRNENRCLSNVEASSTHRAIEQIKEMYPTR